MKVVYGLHFMVDVLEVVKDLSLSWQDNKAFIAEMHRRINTQHLELEGLQIEDGESVELFHRTFKPNDTRMINGIEVILLIFIFWISYINFIKFNTLKTLQYLN